jgi:hypothetical protein
MSPEQIEAAARELCRMKGLDADAMDGTGYLVVSREPWMMKEGAIANWRLLVPEIERFIQVGTAIAAVAELPKPSRKKRLDSAVG